MKKSSLHNSTAIVIGSGVGGLATAARLAARGCQVTVYEQCDHYGGKVSRIEKDGYTWGFGASLLTLPELLDDAFISCGKRPADYYQYDRIDPICHYFYRDGTQIVAHADRDKFANEAAAKTGEPAENITTHLRRIEKRYDLTKDIFLFHSLHRWRTYLSGYALRALLHLGSLGMMTSMHRANRKQFQDPRIAQLFDRYATYNGSDPYLAPSTMSVTAHPEYNKGAYFLHGGMPALTRSLHRLAVDLGTKFECNTPVDSIHITDGRATGVYIKGTVHKADIVVSNMDMVYTYQKLMPAEPAPQRAISYPKSTSAIIFYWGIKRKFPQLDLHNIFFTADYRAEFDCLTNKKTVYHDPTIYVYISSKKQKDHAPAGCENWFVLINAPNDTGQDWDSTTAEVREHIIARLTTALGVDIASLITTETVNHPASIQRQTGSYLGALYGNSSNDILSAFLRHPNFSPRIKNLYFCGGSVHPGGGVPLCLLSARIIDELIP